MNFLHLPSISSLLYSMHHCPMYNNSSTILHKWISGNWISSSIELYFRKKFNILWAQESARPFLYSIYRILTHSPIVVILLHLYEEKHSNSPSRIVQIRPFIRTIKYFYKEQGLTQTQQYKAVYRIDQKLISLKVKSKASESTAI